jgi:hypothetical protein
MDSKLSKTWLEYRGAKAFRLHYHNMMAIVGIVAKQVDKRYSAVKGTSYVSIRVVSIQDRKLG